MGLIFGAHALKTHRCDVVIGGEPADDVLGSSRVFFDASSDAHRAHLWRECLRDTTPRSIHLLRGAARLLAAEAAVPYADPRLVRAASATAWGALQDTSAVTRGPGLSGPGFKPLQKRVARALPVRALQEICAETKLGLPHSSQSHWLALKMLLGSSSDHETFRRMWRLSALLYEATVCDGQPPEAVPAAQIIDGISRNLVDVRKSVQVPQ
ncbi:MAG: hypothetical protein H0U22_06435 [Geodermatophilaceae bacterium]|nr:hypothetical protein [Geodermatophilaceae bacterium]